MPSFTHHAKGSVEAAADERTSSWAIQLHQIDAAAHPEIATQTLAMKRKLSRRQAVERRINEALSSPSLTEPTD